MTTRLLPFTLAACAFACTPPDRDEQGFSPASTGAGVQPDDGTTSADGSSTAQDDQSGGSSTGDDHNFGSTGPIDDPGDASSSSGGVDEGGASFGSGSNFDDVLQMFDYFNEQREGYLSHDRWRGLPFFNGSGHQMVTWPTTFAWDDALATQAQAEADALAAGGQPQGTPSSDGITPAIYILGVDTAQTMISGIEHAGSWGQENQSSLSHHHGAARMSMFYHDPGGAGPVLSRLGIGAAASGGDTWWVLIMG